MDILTAKTIVLGCSAVGAGLAMIAGLGPVSYTHLDVYKRQLIDINKNLINFFIFLSRLYNLI